MGERCGILVEVEFQHTPDLRKAFWKCPKAETGGLYGQRDGWRSWIVWTPKLNELGDMIGVSLRRETIHLYLREASPSKDLWPSPANAPTLPKYP